MDTLEEREDWGSGAAAAVGAMGATGWGRADITSYLSGLWLRLQSRDEPEHMLVWPDSVKSIFDPSEVRHDELTPSGKCTHERNGLCWITQKIITGFLKDCLSDQGFLHVNPPRTTGSDI